MSAISLFDTVFGAAAKSLRLRRGDFLFHRGEPAGEVFADDAGRLRLERSLEDGTAVTLAGQPEEGLEVTVTTADASAVDRVRGLGFFGFLAAGNHHLPHHRAMAFGAGHP